jgi:poly(A) polymerase/tRNA nucleotidyltransferase (CCA-adding enzyme)
MQEHIEIPEDLLKIVRKIADSGFACYLVGGAIRDHFLSRPANDWDIATNATPEQILRLFPSVIPTGIKHGTVTIVWRGRHYEATTFRTESTYSDGRHPDGVMFASTIEEDLSRRDFTMNAIAYDPLRLSFVDPFDGHGDIIRKTIRAIGDARERFDEDGLRPLRAVRFAAQLGFEIEASTFEAIGQAIPRFLLIAEERIREEMVKLLVSPIPSKGIRLLRSSGLLEHVLPELAACISVDQGGYHSFDVFDHSLLACDSIRADPILRLAALLHDIGKPACRELADGGRYSFHRHESIGAELAEKAMRRLRFSTDEIRKVSHLIKQHMFSYDASWTDAAVRRFVARIGEENIGNAFELRFADGFALAAEPIDPNPLTRLRERIDGILAARHALCVKDLAISGNDLASIGMRPSPEMGAMLSRILDAVIEDPGLNTKETLLDMAKRWIAT